MRDRRGNSSALFVMTAVVLSLAAVLAGCVSKSKADARARMAYVAGQQAARRQMQLEQQAEQNPTGAFVRFIGQVDKPEVPWFDGLTLVRAIAAAGYYAPTNPQHIIIHRDTQIVLVDPKILLEGDDLPVQAGDVIELQQ